jgi:hypothetical protein
VTISPHLAARLLVTCLIFPLACGCCATEQFRASDAPYRGGVDSDRLAPGYEGEYPADSPVFDKLRLIERHSYFQWFPEFLDLHQSSGIISDKGNFSVGLTDPPRKILLIHGTFGISKNISDREYLEIRALMVPTAESVQAAFPFPAALMPSAAKMGTASVFNRDERIIVRNSSSASWHDCWLWVNKKYVFKIRDLPAGGELRIDLTSFLDAKGDWFCGPDQPKRVVALHLVNGSQVYAIRFSADRAD